MLFTITGKHIEITQAIREHAEEKTSKLPKYYNSINQVEVVIDGNHRWQSGWKYKCGSYRKGRAQQGICRYRNG